MVVHVPAGNWTVPDLASFFHGVQHRYLTNGGTVDEILNEPADWGYSIALVAGVMASFAIIVIVWDIIIRLLGSCFCTCCCKKSVDDYGMYGQPKPSGGWCTSDGWISSPAKPGHACRWWFATVISVIAVGIFVAGVNSSFQLKSNIDDMSDIARDLDAYKSEVTSNGYHLISLVDATIGNVRTIRSASTDEPEIQRECNTAESQLSDAKSQMNRYLTIVPNQTATPFINDVQDGVRQVPSGHIGLLVLFTICALFLLGLTRRGAIASKPCSYSFCQVFTMLFFLATWLSVCIYFGLVVGMSDACMDPYQLGHKAAGKWLSAEEVNIVDYYATCSGVNPLKSRADQATGYLAEASKSVVNLRTYATLKKPSLLPTINEMDRNVKSANASVHDLITILGCNRLSTSFHSALVKICGDKGMLGNLAQLFFYIGCAEFMFIVARWFLPICNCCRRRHDAGDKQRLLDIAAEGQPNGGIASQNPFSASGSNNNSGGGFGGYAAAPISPHGYVPYQQPPVARATVYVAPVYVRPSAPTATVGSAYAYGNNNSQYVPLETSQKRGATSGW